MYRTRFSPLIFCAMLAVGGTAASATVIDFTSASTGPSGSLFGGKVTWGMTASGMLNNSQLYDGKKKPSGTPLSFERDGYGVGAHDDEITTSAKAMEWIEVTFSRAVNIDAIYFLDLFRATKSSNYEVGVATFDGKKSKYVEAVDFNGLREDGFAYSIFKPIKASSIRFTVLSSNDNFGFADGALAGISVASVPVPAAGIVLLGALAGLFGLRRTRRYA